MKKLQLGSIVLAKQNGLSFQGVVCSIVGGTLVLGVIGSGAVIVSRELCEVVKPDNFFSIVKGAYRK